MYFTSLPDHREPGFDEQLHFSKFKRHNIIFNALSSKSHCEHHVGCLSIKTVSCGEEWYQTSSNPLAVKPGQFLVLNDDQEYSSWINSSNVVNFGRYSITSGSILLRREAKWKSFTTPTILSVVERVKFFS